MTRLLFIIGVLAAIVALIVRSPRAKQVLWTVFAILGAYAVLKLTGVIDALAPDRMG